MLKQLRNLPNWMLLSLAMNGLLFIAVLFGLRDGGNSPVQTNSVLPQANASVSADALATDASVAGFVPQLGDRQYLDYQQWVDLLRQEAQATRNAPRLTVLLGDSISLWFPSSMLPGRRTWINQAISGEHSDMLLRRLDSLDESNVETIFLMIGINDLIAGKPEGQVTQNIQETIVYLKKHHPNAEIVVQSILPHGAENATWEGRDRLLQLPNDRIQAVNIALEQVATKHKVHYLNLYPLFANGEGALRPDLTTDGVHLNDLGYLVWRTAIALLLSTELED